MQLQGGGRRGPHDCQPKGEGGEGLLVVVASTVDSGFMNQPPVCLLSFLDLVLRPGGSLRPVRESQGSGRRKGESGEVGEEGGAGGLGARGEGGA